MSSETPPCLPHRRINCFAFGQAVFKNGYSVSQKVHVLSLQKANLFCFGTFFEPDMQFKHKICKRKLNYTGRFLIRDHFTNYAEELDSKTVSTRHRVRQFPIWWFARNETASTLTSDNETLFTRDLTREFIRLSHVPQLFSAANHLKTQRAVECASRPFLNPNSIFCSSARKKD